MGLRKGDTNRIKEEVKLFKRIYEIANRDCKDPSTVNGAVLVYDNFYQGAIGSWNQLIIDKGEEENDKILNSRILKYDCIQHAERNLIYSIIKSPPTKTYGESIKNSLLKDFSSARMYITWLPCLECAKTIIGVGIKEVVIHEHSHTWDRPDWIPQMKKALALFLEAGVSVQFFKKRIGVKTLFNGKVIAV